MGIGSTKKEVILNNQGLVDIPPDIFADNEINLLSVDVNNLKKIDPKIKKLTNLTKLSLSYNKLVSLPSEMAELPITGLNVNSNQLIELPASFGRLSSLTTAQIQYNHLHSLPESFSTLTNLSKLYLENNKFKVFPPQILTLSTLKQLNLSGNQEIERIPKDISKLQNLKKLELNYLTLREIPIELSFLPNLVYLDVSTNRLQGLPNGFGSNCTNLETLNISYNELDCFPEEIGKMIHLKMIDLRGNSVDFTDCKELQNFTGMKRTDTPKPNEIMEGLYLGGITTTQSSSGLTTLGITHILSTCVEQIIQFQGRDYHQIPVVDEKDQNIKLYFQETNEFIQKARDKGGKVLVHCNRGISRSAAFMVAYVMWVNKWGLEVALNFVKSKREVIYPNQGFMRQLEEYQRELGI